MPAFELIFAAALLPAAVSAGAAVPATVAADEPAYFSAPTG